MYSRGVILSNPEGLLADILLFDHGRRFVTTPKHIFPLHVMFTEQPRGALSVNLHGLKFRMRSNPQYLDIIRKEVADRELVMCVRDEKDRTSSADEVGSVPKNIDSKISVYLFYEVT